MFVFLILDANVVKDEIYLISSITNWYKLSRLHLLCNTINENNYIYRYIWGAYECVVKSVFLFIKNIEM